SQTMDLLGSGHPALDLFDQASVRAAATADKATITSQERTRMERALDVATWFDLHKPEIKLN
ncbi:hypothetical protein ADK38_29900, partial [Streptomyces varsoviensis]